MENNRGYENRTATTTHIRTMLAQGVSCLSVKFFNANLSLQAMPYNGKDQSGKDQYDRNASVITTLNYDGAALLLKLANDILGGRCEGNFQATIMCNAGATVTLSRPQGQGTSLIIAKDGKSVTFPFTVINISVQQNGQTVSRAVETGLDVFSKILYAYLTGINSDRHLDKWTEEFIKVQEEQGGGNQGNNGNRNGGGYQQPGGFQRNNSGYRNNGYQRNNGNGGYRNNNGGGYRNNGNHNQGNGNGMNSTPAPWDNSTPSYQTQPSAPTVGISDYTISD